MFNDTVFRIAFAVSLSLHFFAISAGSFFQNKLVRDNRDNIEITYLIPEMPKDAIEKVIEKLPEKYDLEEKELKKLEQKPSVADENTLLESAKKITKEQYLEEEGLKELEEYIAYYELIRERIKNRVSLGYTRSSREGSVDVTFTLTRNGSLKAIVINERTIAADATLQNLAAKAIKTDAPFPAFPDSLKRDELTFTLSIIFKKD